MASRGTWQLKRLVFHYCDLGGSSKVMRHFLTSETLKEFRESNPQFEYEAVMHRGRHPYVLATYINGFKKSLPIVGKKEEDIHDGLMKMRNSFGRKKYDKLRDRVLTRSKSVQGGWKPNMWGIYPKHKMGKVDQLPPLDWLIPPREVRPEIAERTVKKDPFKVRFPADDKDSEDQRHMY